MLRKRPYIQLNSYWLSPACDLHLFFYAYLAMLVIVVAHMYCIWETMFKLLPSLEILDKQSDYPSSMKLPFTVNGDHHGKPQLDIIHRPTDVEEPSTNKYICIIHSSCVYNMEEGDVEGF